MRTGSAKFMVQAKVLKQELAARDTYRMRLEAPRIAAEARPGQFLMLAARPGLDPFLKRPFSLHRILPDEGAIEVLYRVVGRGTWWLSQSSPGSRLEAVGPLGNGFSPVEPEDHSPVVLVAGGIGIAPLLELMIQLSAAGSRGRMHLFYGTRTASEQVGSDAFEAMGVTVHVSTDDGTAGYHGSVPRLLETVVKEKGLQPGRVYSCGPLAMQYAVARWALAHRVAAELSLESLMACGIGACLGCALPAPHPLDPSAEHYVHVCKDGPIFSPGSIAWNRIQRHQAAPQTFLYS